MHSPRPYEQRPSRRDGGEWIARRHIRSSRGCSTGSSPGSMRGMGGKAEGVRLRPRGGPNPMTERILVWPEGSDRISSPGHTELVQDVVHVILDRRQLNAQAPRYLLI